MDLIQQLDGLQGLSSRRLDGLCEVPGIGLAKAAQMRVAIDLGEASPGRAPFDRDPSRT